MQTSRYRKERKAAAVYGVHAQEIEKKSAYETHKQVGAASCAQLACTQIFPFNGSGKRSKANLWCQDIREF